MFDTEEILFEDPAIIWEDDNKDLCDILKAKFLNSSFQYLYNDMQPLENIHCMERCKV